MILKATCEMQKNEKVEDYIGIRGINYLELIDDDGESVAKHIHNNVLWCGSGSPYPTPAGGPWGTDYIANHKRFGQCFKVNSDMEGDIFVHFAKEKSYGCFVINPNGDGKKFMKSLVQFRKGLKVVNEKVIDNRSDEDKESNPIDYEKIGKIK